MVRENVIAQQANLRTHPSVALAESRTTVAVTSRNLRQV
ncbi:MULTISPECIES: carbonic anhydrase [Ralstonia]|uniref:Carbonic anhydrase n=1 Tax=Ralstonia chuxiongensis TaxID=2957504 RepID=A0AA41WUI3_9RALS|nr:MULTISPECIES: carbonic anhydrase [Ralstonia]MCP1175196.1 carbonic anhydrase [Ralstonia chuxiongensis]HWV03479.1 carbonic anhydrase [Ralstonia sp.]